jgi:ATP-dependent RNA helicase DDX3X
MQEDDVFVKKESMSTGINFDSYDAIPVELTGKGSKDLEKVDTFGEAKVHELLLANVKRLKYQRPTPGGYSLLKIMYV